jgi:hypothetical protein
MMPQSNVADEDWEDDPNDDDTNVESGDSDPASTPNRGWSKDYPGFSRNPIFVSVLKASVLITC